MTLGPKTLESVEEMEESKDDLYSKFYELNSSKRE